MADDDDRTPGALNVADWLFQLGQPYGYDEVVALRAQLDAPDALPLTDRERRAFALVGLVILKMAEENAGRMFAAMAGSAGVGVQVVSGAKAFAMAAALGLVRPPGDDDDDDDDSGNGKPS